MLGAIIGDIVGSRFEFNNCKSTEFELLLARECTYTDDTICTIAVANAILRDIPFADSLQYWCRKYPNPTGGYGARFAAWIRSSDAPPYGSYGNGSAMRVSPCAWYDNEREWVLEKARQSAECTHNHSEGIKGAICVADCIYHARQGMSKSKIKTLVEINYGYNLNQTCDEIRVTNSFDETCQVTVPQAIVCFLESNSFEHAVRLAVSIGGDSDTIAAITGGIAEAYHGIPVNIALNALQYLPQEFVSVLNNFNENMKISTPHKEIV